MTAYLFIKLVCLSTLALSFASTLYEQHCKPAERKAPLSTALHTQIACPATLSAAPRRRGDHQTSPAQPVIKMAALAFPKRLAGKKVAIFIDYQFEDLEVTFPMLRSVQIKFSLRVPFDSLVDMRTG